MKKPKINIILICIITIIIATITIYAINKKTNITTNDESELTTFNEAESTIIEFTEDKQNNVSITKGGTYTLTGKNDNSSITIDTEEEVILILNNLELTNQTGPAITVENAKQVVITLKDDTTNKLSDGKNTNQENDATIFSKDNLTINGNGTLEINTTFENGIKCNDELKILSGNIEINANTNGIIGKDSITIKSGNITITSGQDGIKSDNDEEEKGNIIIEDANIKINSKNDGIQAQNNLTINNGTFNITTSNGASELIPKQGWETTTEEESAKSLKAGTTLTINNGTFTLDSKDDAIHSNGNTIINNGTYTIKSSEDGIHADSLVEINNGTINITASEGIEATYVKINKGNITIEASDDGINAGAKTKDYTPTIEINEGNIIIKMTSGDTDGIDSNGNIYINGGTIDITGNSPFDYDLEAKYTGGKIIVNGEETNQITNQMMGPMMQGGMNQTMQGGREMQRR